MEDHSQIEKLGKVDFKKKEAEFRPMETVGQSVHEEDAACRGGRSREEPSWLRLWLAPMYTFYDLRTVLGAEGSPW